jgi:hexulose-6-phosphate isomerase
MQGRLSAPVGGRIQSFPVDTWRDEFQRAWEAGLDCIEWIYETGTDGVNPLGTDAGIDEIRHLSNESKVAIYSICADYYMDKHLVRQDGSAESENMEHLLWLIGRGRRLGIRYIVLPFVDSSSLKSDREIKGLHAVLNKAAMAASEAEVELHLETDFAPSVLVGILERIAHPRVRANLDIGNSASLGHDPVEELSLLAPWLGSVHVKDRVLGGGTVPLGTGSADFATSFKLILKAGFHGPFILQAARQNGFSEVELARCNRNFVIQHVMSAAKEV